MSFLARLMADHDLRALTAAGIGVARPSFRLLNKEVRRALGQLPRRVREARASTIMEFTVFALAAHRGAVAGEALSNLSFERYVDDLVQLVEGMLAAPGSAASA